ncbi:MAG: SRPBCC domain-containing protein [Devosia sp.]
MSVLRIDRHYAITPEQLFAYITEKDSLLQWWGPEGTTAIEANLDLTRLGPYSLVLQSPRGPFAMRGIVKNVTPPWSVEFTMNVPGDDAPDSTVRFQIESDGKGGANFALIQSGITDQMVEMGTHGWASTLGRLEQLIGAGARS